MNYNEHKEMYRPTAKPVAKVVPVEKSNFLDLRVLPILVILLVLLISSVTGMT